MRGRFLVILLMPYLFDFYIDKIINGIEGVATGKSFIQPFFLWLQVK